MISGRKINTFFHGINRELILINHYEDLAIKMLDLANVYCNGNKRSYVKYAGLIHFVISLLEQLNSKKYAGIIIILNKCSVLNLKEYLLLKSAENFDILKINFKEDLKKIRKNLFYKFINFNQNKITFSCLCKITQKTMDRFFQFIISNAIHTLGSPPCEFSIAYLGSNARGQAAHCSDVEFIMIVSHSNELIYQYFQDLTQLILLLIISIGETILPAFNIPELSAMYDNITPHGYSLDGNLPQAGKTPLGAKTFGKRQYRLIGTPDELSEFATIKWYKHDRYFPQLLCLSRYIYGDSNLYETFIDSLKKKCNRSYVPYGLALFSYDIEKYIEILESSFEVISHKKQYFRPINSLIDDLYILTGFVKNNTNKLRILHQMNYISSQSLIELNKILNHMLIIRYYRHNSYMLIKSLPMSKQKPLLELTNIKKNVVMKSHKIILNTFNFFKEKMGDNERCLLLNESKLCNEFARKKQNIRSRL
jgi:hypothetical protein